MMGKTNKGPVLASLLAAVGLGVSGCAAGVVADAASMGASGKSLTDHTLDAATGKDCRLIAGATRADRDVCEAPGSAATKRDFKGLGGGESRKSGSG